MQKNDYFIFMLLFLFGTTHFIFGQTNPFEEGFCIVDLKSPSQPEASRTIEGDSLSSNGFDFTPRGDLRVLTIFVDFEDTTDQNQPFSGWAAGQLPDIVDPETGRIIFAAQEDSDFSPLGNPAPNAQQNISEFFYHMSNGEFRLFYETLKDDEGNPIVLTIDVNGDEATGTPPTEFGIDLNTLVFEELNQQFPNRDWSALGFDIRPDRPGWTQDASATEESPNPNTVLDFITVVYRYRLNFPEPVNGIGDFPFSPDILSTRAVAAASLFGDFQLSNDFSATERGGFTLLQYSTDLANLQRLFIHELSHNFILRPHTSVENTVHGRSFNAYRDWSMMDYGRSSSIATAWERWYTGWLDIRHDLNSVTDNGDYLLGDFMQTGDAMRLQLPHTPDQFLWLTFRSDIDNPFYQRIRPDSEVVRPVGSPPNEIPLPVSNEGLYGLFERIAATREETDVFDLFVDGANGTRIMDGKGFYDFSVREIIRPQSPVLVDLTQDRPNAYGQLGTAVGYRSDLNEDNTILHLPTVNGGGSPNEFANIRAVDGEAVFGRNAADVALADGKYSAFTNPSISNFIEFNDFEPNNPFEPFEDDGIEALSPTILHSLSFTSQRLGDDIQITVDYDDGHIEQDFRMTGNILLPASERITLDEGFTLTINQSLNNGRETVSPLTNSFVTSSVFKAASGSYLCISEGATLLLDEETTALFEPQSGLTIERNAQLIIRNGAQLCLNTDLLTLDPTAQIIVEDGFINISGTTDISENIVFTDPDFSAIGTSPDCVVDFFFGSTIPPATANLEISLESSIQVFPNPSSIFFNVAIQNTPGPYTYQLFNTNGQLIREETINKNVFTVDTSQLATGIYFFTLDSSNFQEVQKIVKL